MRPILLMMWLAGSASAQPVSGVVPRATMIQAPPPAAPAAPPTHQATPLTTQTLTVPPQGVPPTPAQAFPGLPVPPTTSGLPSGTPTSPQAQEVRTAVPLTPSQVADLQSRLTTQGFYHGPLDGAMNASTRSALRAFQEAARIPATGQADAVTTNALGVSGPNAANANFPPFALSPDNQGTFFIQP